MSDSERFSALLDAYRDAILFTQRAMQMRSDTLEDEGIVMEREARAEILKAYQDELDSYAGACADRESERQETARLRAEVERLTRERDKADEAADDEKARVERYERAMAWIKRNPPARFSGRALVENALDAAMHEEHCAAYLPFAQKATPCDCVVSR